MHNNDTLGKNWVYSISGQPVYSQTPQNKTPVPHEKTVREELEEQAKLLEERRFRQQAQQTSTPEQPPYLQFDGQELIWYNNGIKYRSWPAVSGKADYQSPEYQNLAKLGPLPEGNWKLRQDRFQQYDDLSNSEKITNEIGKIPTALKMPMGKWPGGRWAWGNSRIWLEPESGTNTYGRSNFSIHGGSEAGSAGCIDLTDKMDDFANTFRNYGHDLLLKVKYPRK